MKNRTQIISLEKIEPSVLNPRKTFDEESLLELSASIEELGLLQPITVYKNDGYYQIIIGERRWRAAKLAGLKRIKCMVIEKEMNNLELQSIALAENIQRKDIEILEEAFAISSLIKNSNLKISKLAKKLGVTPTYILSRQRLVLYEDIIEAFKEKIISFSEAKELARLSKDKIRKRFLRCLNNDHYFQNFQVLRKSVSKICKLELLKRELDGFKERIISEKRILKSLRNLKICGPECEHFYRLSWDDKKDLECLTDKPGWTDICANKDYYCYKQKKEALFNKLKQINDLDKSKPINPHLMKWEKNKDGNYCRDCKYHKVIPHIWRDLISNQENEDYDAFCVSKSNKCYQLLRRKVSAKDFSDKSDKVSINYCIESEDIEQKIKEALVHLENLKRIILTLDGDLDNTKRLSEELSKKVKEQIREIEYVIENIIIQY